MHMRVFFKKLLKRSPGEYIVDSPKLSFINITLLHFFMCQKNNEYVPALSQMQAYASSPIAA